MTIMSYFGKNIEICFIGHIPNIRTFRHAKFQPIIYFLSKVNFSERSKFGGKKAAKLLKQIFKKHSHVMCQQKIS